METTLMRNAISLDNWSQTLRPYQQDAVNRALRCYSSEDGQRTLLLACPTGTGKGTMQLGLLKALQACEVNTLIVTPSLEVVRGYLERCGASREDLECSAGQLARMGERINVTTPVRLRNALRSGKLAPPEALIIDEAHHATLDNVQGGGLRELCPGATWIGFTATPFRGSPQETEDLKLAWGEPSVILTIPQAVKLGAWALPSWRVEAILDDDSCGLKGGDIDADEITLTSVKPLASFVRTLDLSKPTCVTVNGVEAARALADEFTAQGVPALVVLGDTPPDERARTYATCAQGGVVLVSVKVLGEGVDMPWLRRWVDSSPTLSPVAFLQKLGRITRPGALAPEYVGVCRNLERHAYLLGGEVPRSVIKDAQERFGGPSVRGGRAGLLKGMGKLKPITLPLADGVQGTMWALTEFRTDGQKVERAIMLDPTSERVVSAWRTCGQSLRDGSKWTACPLPEQITGIRPAKTGGPCSDIQFKWWRQAASRHGLDVETRPTKAQFFALPPLIDLGISMADTTRTQTRPAPTTPSTQPSKPAASATQPSVSQAPAAQPVRALDTAPAVRTPRGYFTVQREDGSHRTYRTRVMDENSTFAPGKTVLDLLRGPDNTSDYVGVGFVAGTDFRVWGKFSRQGAEIAKDWAAISGDLNAAGKRYAMRSGNCYRCGRLLTSPESVASGIGPICAGF